LGLDRFLSEKERGSSLQHTKTKSLVSRKELIQLFVG